MQVTVVTRVHNVVTRSIVHRYVDTANSCFFELSHIRPLPSNLSGGGSQTWWSLHQARHRIIYLGLHNLLVEFSMYHMLGRGGRWIFTGLALD